VPGGAACFTLWGEPEGFTKQALDGAFASGFQDRNGGEDIRARNDLIASLKDSPNCDPLIPKL